MNRISKYLPLFWVQVGKDNSRMVFYRLADIVTYLNRLQVGAATYWRMGRETGFETTKYNGDNYITLYQGDREGNIVSALLPDERILIEEGLLEQFV